jgi:hypothetical protein
MAHSFSLQLKHTGNGWTVMALKTKFPTNKHDGKGEKLRDGPIRYLQK